MLDAYNRNIHYLRISVTDKCNLRCIYCMPEEGIPLKSHADMLTYEEIDEIVKAAASLGITKIRLTGGEPLVKRDVEVLVKKLVSITGIEQVNMTTNGILLEHMAPVLKENGLHSVNISLDALSPEKYSVITRGGNITRVLSGIDAAIAHGFPVKINMVVMKNTTEQDINDMKDFCQGKGLGLQLINHFSLTSTKENTYYFDRPPACADCNRIRLLADGTLKPCLHSDLEYKIDMQNIEQSLIEVIEAKPENGLCCNERSMWQIGG